MNRKLYLIFIALVITLRSFGQNYVSKELPLYNVLTDTDITLAKFDSHSAIVLVYTSIHCPYAKLYKERISSMSDQYASQNVRFAFVNANANHPSNKETIKHMKDEANTSNQNVLYLADKNHTVRKALNVEKNPEVIILTPISEGYRKVYQGAIDDSPQSESTVRKNYVQMTLNSILTNKTVPLTYQRPVGCRIK
ncbi:redoxin family protein [Reichenbachiella carrageenanivorans]|uniref:Redoxin family protein n=1 Tax=Reichenbachiella carrageenanivorans TaxID=2979869 RepID=A0ABY6D286_9BACT|nr:redoxin family protein [Reichenbachiella carrageenanivorans]UXX79183.1 redoxin family protein [Reichenbachiella carrageenanivorans]